MANFNLPKNRTEVYNRLVSDVTANLPESGSFLRASYIKSIVIALAFRVYDVYKKILIMINQFFIQTASGVYLERWGQTYGITRNAATPATGNVVVTGTAATSIPLGTGFQSADGNAYTATSDGTISTSNITASSVSRTGTTVTVNFTSAHGLASGMTIDSITGATPADFNTTNAVITVTSSTQFQYTLSGTTGSASGTINIQFTKATIPVSSDSQGDVTNVASGGLLTLSSPISGVDSNAFVDIGEISGGTNIETDDSYRERVLFRIQQPFSFFNINALISKAKEVAGVTRVWVFTPQTTSSSLSISSLTRSGDVAIATINAHGLVDGSFITVTGADQNDYNVIQQRVIVLGANTIAYPVENTPTTPATGTISASYSYVEEGQVRIGFTRDNDSSIIPSSTEVNTTKEKLLTIKPAHVTDDDVIVFAPTAVPIAITFSALNPNTSAMQTAITSELTDFFKTSNEIGVNVELADIKAAINNAIDSGGNTPSYTLSSPSSDTTISLNQIGTLGTITYP